MKSAVLFHFSHFFLRKSQILDLNEIKFFLNFNKNVKKSFKIDLYAIKRVDRKNVKHVLSSFFHFNKI